MGALEALEERLFCSLTKMRFNVIAGSCTFLSLDELLHLFEVVGVRSALERRKAIFNSLNKSVMIFDEVFDMHITSSLVDTIYTPSILFTLG